MTLDQINFNGWNQYFASYIIVNKDGSDRDARIFKNHPKEAFSDADSALAWGLSQAECYYSSTGAVSISDKDGTVRRMEVADWIDFSRKAAV
jgi:hypothetical protein